jgi:hypothetical protein
MCKPGVPSSGQPKKLIFLLVRSRGLETGRQDNEVSNFCAPLKPCRTDVSIGHIFDEYHQMQTDQELAKVFTTGMLLTPTLAQAL